MLKQAKEVKHVSKDPPIKKNSQTTVTAVQPQREYYKLYYIWYSISRGRNKVYYHLVNII